MRLRRSKQPVAEPDQEATVDLSRVPMPALWFEMQRRGFEALPEGAWEETIGKLEARTKEAEKCASSLETRLREVAPVAHELADLAGTELPKAVAQVIDLGRENRQLRDQAQRSEEHVSVLAEALVGEEFPGHIEDGSDE